MARYKKPEMFGSYYNTIFDDLNAAQMILAVLIFRYCDANCKKPTEDKDLHAMRSYSHYFLACMVGTKMLRDLNIEVNSITHKNFTDLRDYFDNNKDDLISWSEDKLKEILVDYFDLDDNQSISDIDGRTMAVAFRRFDIVENCFKNPQWWSTVG